MEELFMGGFKLALHEDGRGGVQNSPQLFSFAITAAELLLNID
jgi:hypothetical protein